VGTPYALFHELRALYQSGRKLRLRRSRPNHAELNRRRRHLIQARILTPDPDYRTRAYRIVANSDGSAEEICCQVDRFAYISHLSAMARYGLTNRRPRALHLTVPHQHIIGPLLQEAMATDYGQDTLETLDPHEIESLHRITHPAQVRSRPLTVLTTREPGNTVPVRGTGPASPRSDKSLSRC
jgi:hypothetical protein